MTEYSCKIENLYQKNNRQRFLDLYEDLRRKVGSYFLGKPDAHKAPSAFLRLRSPFSTLLPGLR